ncbi:hypothetical protein [Quadrisphaera setariae]|uniref:Uncharacterized protein n=1 Tax=Quadrisphaera setariae TaxID=2593304 RepID=A0A5C8Z3V1_9ACTN|nr:hypothetical protein [Quadrisphaera setariae]TXR51586.1 hypothetical protein FMM08_22320 [Quadrisphaera setariae]
MSLPPLLVQAISALTLLFAYLGYRVLRQRWAHDQAVHAQEEDRRWRAAAQRVWVSVQEQDWPRLDAGTYRARVATIRNDSEGPARELDLWWFLDGKALPLDAGDRHAALAPGEVWTVVEPTWLTHMGEHHQVTARLWFTDLYDQCWETSHRGQVRPLREAVHEGYEFLDGHEPRRPTGPTVSPR